METRKYVRKPLFVDAVQVTNENFVEIAAWCQGEIQNNDGSDLTGGSTIDPAQTHIRVRVNNPQSVRQTKAFVGDWLLYGKSGYKVYTKKAFAGSFDPVDGELHSVHEGQQAFEEPNLRTTTNPEATEPVQVAAEDAPVDTQVPVSD